MAGDQKDINAPEIEIVDPFERMNGLLGDIFRALSNRGDDTRIWDLTGIGAAGPLSQHPRFRVRDLVVTVDAAAAVTFTVGTFSRVFNFAMADTKVIPLPVIIERGTDVTLAASAGTVGGYLIGTTE